MYVPSIFDLKVIKLPSLKITVHTWALPGAQVQMIFFFVGACFWDLYPSTGEISHLHHEGGHLPTRNRTSRCTDPFPKTLVTPGVFWKSVDANMCSLILSSNHIGGKWLPRFNTRLWQSQIDSEGCFWRRIPIALRSLEHNQLAPIGTRKFPHGPSPNWTHLLLFQGALPAKSVLPGTWMNGVLWAWCSKRDLWGILRNCGRRKSNLKKGAMIF